MHLARAGWLQYRDAFKSPAPLKPGSGPIAIRVRLDDGSGFDITEAGTQKKLAVYLVSDPALVPGVAKLGPDALAATPEVFAARIRSRRAQLKGLLTDQSVLAGVGNAYSDEILHVARLSPFALAGSLGSEEVERLYAALKGHGATVRYVTLPHEAHSYAARETLLHVIAERLNWFDKYVRNAAARSTTDAQR